MIFFGRLTRSKPNCEFKKKESLNYGKKKKNTSGHESKAEPILFKRYAVCS